MAEALARLEVDDLQQSLREIQVLLAKPERSSALRARLDALHAADIAYILEALPLEQRLAVWNLVKADRDGEILLEVSEAVRESLIASMDSAELVAAAETLQADELADIAADLPPAVMEDVVQSLPAQERERLRAALSYPEGSVGSLMDFDHVAVREEEDVFAPVLESFKNRWAWLAINLVTAFIASRVIGLFEGSIERLVALAALMPIVAGVGGNSGNQTITMIVRALALGQIQGGYWRALLRKEIGLALLNGVIWGCLLGAVAYTLYGNVAVGGVMPLAMVLTLVRAAVMGVAIPWLRSRFGRDPAVGSSVLITACTDSGGFFIFLGLATLFLV